MRKAVTTILFALSLGIAFLGYQNSQPSDEVLMRSKTVACGSVDGCEVTGEQPHTRRTSIFGHEYEWTTSKGSVKVVCKPEYFLAGNFKCESVNAPAGEPAPVS